MTPKEKAQELYFKYYPYLLHYSNELKNMYAKDCALINVEEIIDAIKVFHNGADWQLYETMGWKYWQQVKEEINKL